MTLDCYVLPLKTFINYLLFCDSSRKIKFKVSVRKYTDCTLFLLPKASSDRFCIETWTINISLTNFKFSWRSNKTQLFRIRVKEWLFRYEEAQDLALLDVIILNFCVSLTVMIFSVLLNISTGNNIHFII